MCGMIETGICSVCGISGPIRRKYYNYDMKCECHSPNHFEIVYVCDTCEPVEPKNTIIHHGHESMSIPTDILKFVLKSITNRKEESESMMSIGEVEYLPVGEVEYVPLNDSSPFNR